MMDEQLLSLLECPVCHSKLDWTINKCNKDHIEQAEASCISCGALYPVQEGIGIFLTPDLPRHDLWEEAGSGLTAYLHEHPQIERKLLETSRGYTPRNIKTASRASSTTWRR